MINRYLIKEGDVVQLDLMKMGDTNFNEIGTFAYEKEQQRIKSSSDDECSGGKQEDTGNLSLKQLDHGKDLVIIDMESF